VIKTKEAALAKAIAARKQVLCRIELLLQKHGPTDNSDDAKEARKDPLRVLEVCYKTAPLLFSDPLQTARVQNSATNGAIDCALCSAIG
jgi:hypothetical protein